MREIAEAARQKRLLDVASDADFLLHALAFAFALDEACIVENAGGFYREGVQNPAVELRERGGSAGVEIHDAEKIAAFILDRRIRGAGPRHGVERNHHDHAQTLRDDAFRSLKIAAGLRQILGNDALLLLDSLPQRRLAGSGLCGGKSRTSSASRETHTQRAGGLGLEQESPVSVRDGDGVIEHAGKHSLQRKSRMQKRGRFEQKIEFVESTGRRVAAGNAVNAAEEIGNRSIVVRRTENEFVEIVHAETDYVAIFQHMAGGFFAVDENSVTLAAIFKVVAAVLRNDGGALARDARVRQLQVLGGFAGAANQEWHFDETHKAAGPVRRNNLESRFAVGGMVRHSSDSTRKL